MSIDWKDKSSLGEGKLVYGQVGYSTAIIEVEGGLVTIDFPAAIEEFKRHQGELDWPTKEELKTDHLSKGDES